MTYTITFHFPFAPDLEPMAKICLQNCDVSQEEEFVENKKHALRKMLIAPTDIEKQKKPEKRIYSKGLVIEEGNIICGYALYEVKDKGIQIKEFYARDTRMDVKDLKTITENEIIRRTVKSFASRVKKMPVHYPIGLEDTRDNEISYPIGRKDLFSTLEF